MNELNNTLMSTAIGAEVTGYVLADVRGVNSMGECAEDTSKGLAPASSVFVCTKPLALQGLVGQHPKPFDRAAPAGRSSSAVQQSPQTVIQGG